MGTKDNEKAKPLHPMVGNMWVPVWAIRPGSYAVLAPIAGTLPLWLVLHSRSGDVFTPCYHTRDQLGATIRISRATASRQLGKLRKAGLLFEVDRGVEPKTQRRRAVARWPLDPFAAEIWRPKVEEALARVAEEDGQDGRWYHNAVTSLEAFERRNKILGAKIGEDMPLDPRPRKRKKKRATTQIEPPTQIESGGEVLYQGGGRRSF